MRRYEFYYGAGASLHGEGTATSDFNIRVAAVLIFAKIFKSIPTGGSYGNARIGAEAFDQRQVGDTFNSYSPSNYAWVSVEQIHFDPPRRRGLLLPERAQSLAETEQAKARQHRDNLLKVHEAIHSGYGGVLPNGNIVDRREHPTATPIPANGFADVPEPKEVVLREQFPLNDYALASEFLLRAAESPCEHWILPATCIIDGGESMTCWPCQARIVCQQIDAINAKGMKL